MNNLLVMFIRIKRKIIRTLKSYYILNHPFLWIYSVYLTLRYVDEYKNFPAIRFNNYVRVDIIKSKKSIIKIDTVLIFDGFLNRNAKTIIIVNENSLLHIENEFVLGDGISILVCPSAILKIKGKEIESASGITANSKIMVLDYLEIGKDALIAWDTFITDSDWHTIEGKNPCNKTIIGDHVWIGVGAKILKGVSIGNNSIITTNSVVVKGEYPTNAMLTGVPAKIVKINIAKWSRDLIFTK